MLLHNTQEYDNNSLATWSSILPLKTNYFSMKYYLANAHGGN
jgi:hypothetical protein